MAVYFVGSQVSANVNSVQNEEEKIFVSSLNIDKSGKFEIDLSDFILMAGQYELAVRTDEDEKLKIKSSVLILQGVVTPGFTACNENGICNINITAHPSGGRGTIKLSGQLEVRNNLLAKKARFYLSKK
jgi:hypothetical protein